MSTRGDIIFEIAYFCAKHGLLQSDATLLAYHITFIADQNAYEDEAAEESEIMEIASSVASVYDKISIASHALTGE